MQCDKCGSRYHDTDEHDELLSKVLGSMKKDDADRQAEAALAKEAKKTVKKKKVFKRRKQFQCVLITGTKSPKKYTLKYLMSCLKKELVDVWEGDPGYVLTGTTRDIEVIITSACKLLKLRVLQAPPNFQMYTGSSAEHMRNADLVNTFKPRTILIFSKVSKEEIKDPVIEALIKTAVKQNIPYKVLVG